MKLTEKQTSIKETLEKYNISSLEEAKEICLKKSIDVEKIVKGIQPICFDNAVKAYELGVAIAIKTKTKSITKNTTGLSISIAAALVATPFPPLNR